MSETGQTPKPRRAKKLPPTLGERVRSDEDILGASRFLKRVLISVVTMTVAVSLVCAGAFVVARVIHLVYTALEAQKIELPEWAHNAEIQGTGLVLGTLILMTVVIVVKDAWRLAAQKETTDDPDEEHKP